MLSMDKVLKAAGAEGRADRGEQDIPLDRIVGSAAAPAKAGDFDPSFLPVSNRSRDRWTRIYQEMAEGGELPPIDVYKLGDNYYVIDGHHRVSVARQLGWDTIKARVVEVQTRAPLGPDVDAEALLGAAEYAGFLEATQLDRVRPGARIHAELALAHLSTGEILRAEAARRSELGLEAARLMKEGHLVPDRLLVPIIRARLQERRGRTRGVLLDGFPRTVEQARALDAMLAKDGRRVDFVVALEAPDELLVKRLLHRAVVEHRPDDTEAAIQERMKEYHQRTAPVLEHYRGAGVPVAEIDAAGSPDEVFARVHDALQPLTVGK